MHLSLNTDMPVRSDEQDRFNRLEFAKRIAAVLTKRADASSISVGVLGEWGEGKSSVLNMIKSNLDTSVVSIDYNPWRFSDDDSMLISFYEELASGLDGIL